MAGVSSKQIAAPPRPKAAQGLSVFVLIDALGWRFLEERPFLQDLLPYRRPLRTVLGFSSGAIPTILTGRTPDQTGHWNLFYYDPQGSPFRWLRHFRFLPDRVLDHRIASKLLKEMGRRVLGLGPLFECCVSPHLLRWFNWVEKRNIYDHGGIPGSSSIFDQLAASGLHHRVYTYHHWTDKEILAQARQDMEADRAGVFFLYLSEMDMFLHTHCANGAEVDRKLAWYDARLREIFQIAGRINPSATFTIFSDHGMTLVRHHYDLMADVAKLGFRMPEDYLVVYDSTMARFWFFSDRARREINRVLEAAPCGRIVPDSELGELGVLFPDRRFGELVFLLHPGWLLSRSGFNGPQWVPAGMHGYHPDDSESDAIFLSSRQPSGRMDTIADIYPHIREVVF